VQQLRDAGFLSAEEAVSLPKPNVDVIIDDRRAVKTPL